MNTYRSYAYTYQAVLEDGGVVQLGTAASETYDNGGTLRSEFGQTRAKADIIFEDDGEVFPDTLVEIVKPEDVHQFWDAAGVSTARMNLWKMLAFCEIPAEAVIGFIVTCTCEDNWESNQAETRIIVKPEYLA